MLSFKLTLTVTRVGQMNWFGRTAWAKMPAAGSEPIDVAIVSASPRQAGGRFRWGLQVVTALALLAMASVAVAAPRHHKALSAAPTTKLQKVFDPDMIDAQVNYLESIVGPARHIEGDERQYKIDGCNIAVRAENSEIKSLSMIVNSKCSFDLDRFFWVEKPGPANRVTFGELERRFNVGQFYADCMINCGNGGRDRVYLAIDGYHAENFHSLTVEPDLNGAGLEAFTKWQMAMYAKGERWMYEKRFNCDHVFDAVAKRAFEKVGAFRVTVSGMTPPTNRCQ